MTRTQHIKGKFVVDSLAKKFPNDPKRCVAYGFAQWKRVRYAYSYRLSYSIPGSTVPYVATQTDDAPYEIAGPGSQVVRNPAPPTSYTDVMGTLKWSSSVARFLFGSYSGPSGCADAEAQVAPLKFQLGSAALSVPVIGLVRRKPPPRRVTKEAPEQTVMRVRYVQGLLFRVDKRGERHRLRYQDWVKKGDVLFVEKGGVAELEMVTGGRLGITGDRAVLILGEAQVKDLTDEGPWTKGVRRTVRRWRIYNNHGHPALVDVMGIAMSIKG